MVEVVNVAYIWRWKRIRPIRSRQAGVLPRKCMRLRRPDCVRSVFWSADAFPNPHVGHISDLRSVRRVQNDIRIIRLGSFDDTLLMEKLRRASCACLQFNTGAESMSAVVSRFMSFLLNYGRWEDTIVVEESIVVVTEVQILDYIYIYVFSSCLFFCIGHCHESF